MAAAAAAVVLLTSPARAPASLFSSSPPSSSSSFCSRRGPRARALPSGGAAASMAVAAAATFPLAAIAALQLQGEPSNALSLPTWAVHVSSVVEWATAMVLVWQYGDRSGLESWKGLSWGMVPLLGGALCACTWHFFYNSESLEILVAMQAALTVVGNITMCIAALRICQKTGEDSKDL